MKSQFNRREFLKMTGLIPLSFSILKWMPSSGLPDSGSQRKNILIIVFDALTAYNISLYGYGRDTMPNLTKIIQQAIVYHNHFAGSNFTTPGTASLLTGTLPWTHRAFSHNETVDEFFIDKNIFHTFSHYNRMAYSHNALADTLLHQFKNNIENYTHREALFITSNPFLSLFSNDIDTAELSWTRRMKKDEGYSYSLFLSDLYEKYVDIKIQKLKADFPRGLPYFYKDEYFTLEDAINWLQDQLRKIKKPFFGYIHFLPPHFPYCTRRDFYDSFNRNDLALPIKPEHLFTEHNSRNKQLYSRTRYDRYLLYVDEEFGRLYNFMKKSGFLDNTWLILTADHGEMFERGIVGHTTPVLNQPVIRIPLVVFEPGREEKVDIYNPTSAIDLLPTLMHLNDQNIPAWCEGVILPPFSTIEPSPTRSIYAVTARGNKKYNPLKLASIMLVKGQYKLIYYYGYKELMKAGELIELYDINNDPEELNNLYTSQTGIAAELLNEIKEKLAAVNEPYLK
jgi:arylsulfatase A-like enzyme